MLRIGASSGAQVLRTIAGIPSGPLDLEVSSWRRVWRTFRIKNLIGYIVNLEGGKRCGWTPWSSRLELEAKTDAKRLALDEGVVEEESELFFTGGKDGKVLGDKFGHRPKGERAILAGSDSVVDAMDKR